MPYVGLSPFLQDIERKFGKEAKVSMPYVGLSPFLRTVKSAENAIAELCQCPMSGFLHFYKERNNSESS